MFNLKDMYFRLQGNPYFQYLSLKDNYEDEMKNLSREDQMEKWKAQTASIKPFMKKYENPYISINHIDEKFLYAFVPGDSIIIQEKIDGSNSHLIVNENGFQSFGMNYELNEKNHLQGFYFWCKDHYTQVTEKYYNLKIYGEWLIPHHCDYQNTFYCNFYVFDIMEDNKYWPQDKVKEFCKECNFNYVPVFYEGKFTSWKDVKTFIGQTKMGTSKGEGIVVKNMTKLNKADKLFYLKLVDVEYQETNSCREIIKTINDEKLIKADETALLVSSIVTKARVRKQILKMRDIGLLPANWIKLDTSKILKQVKSPVIKDCFKEERAVIDTVGKRFSSYAESLIINHINELKEEGI